MRLKAMLAMTALLAIAAAGCGGNGKSSSSGSSAKSITVWSEENDAGRMQTTQQIINRFTAKTGVKVKLVGVDGSQFDQLVTSSAAGGKMPDVMGALPLDAVQYLASNDLVDTKAVGSVLDSLGRNTFLANGLKLTQYKGQPAAVPSDSWAQILVYRKDWFDKANLATPDTYDKIRAAAAALNKKGTTAGIVMATVANDIFTEQTFEDFALGNGCQLVDSNGQPQLTSQQCINAFKFYTDMVRNYSFSGNQDVDSTRATYFAGKAAMVVWSSYLLDELAGLRNDALPTCPECRKDTGYLAKHSGFVTAIQGTDGSKPEAFGEITSWTISKGSHTAAAQQFIEYMLNEGYVDWLGFAPEGKFPVRQGDASDPQKFVTAWKGLKVGVDRKAPLSEFYPSAVLDALKNTPDTMDRWGLPQGQGKLLGATLGELIVPKAINAAASGHSSPEQAAQQAQQAVSRLK